MGRKGIATLAIAWIPYLVGVYVSAQTGTPPTTQLFIDYASEPFTLEQLWDKAALVVLGRVQRAMPVQLDRTRVTQTYVWTLDETFKDAPGAPANRRELILKQPGGTLETAGATLTTHSADTPFQEGEQAFLFLVPRDDHFQLVMSQWSAFRVSGSIVYLPGRPNLTQQEFDGRAHVSTDEFVSNLRSIKLAAPQVDPPLIVAARKLMPSTLADGEIARHFRGGVWNRPKTAVAISILRPVTKVFVFLKQTDGEYLGVDISSIERTNLGMLGTAGRSAYERVETTPIRWLHRQDEVLQLEVRTRVWRGGKRYTAAERLIIRKDGTPLWR